MTQEFPFSERERQVLDLLLEGKSNKLIALALHISERTVEFHLKNIYRKCEVRSRTECILKLGQSTVAAGPEKSENGDQPDERHWAAAFKEAVLRSPLATFIKELPMNVSPNSATAASSSPTTFFESIRTCLTKYAEFNGRADRPELWWFVLFITLAGSALTYIHEAIASVFLIAMLLPLLAVGARRLHDIGKSAWYLFYLLLPVGGLVVLAYYWSIPSTHSLTDEAPTI